MTNLLEPVLVTGANGGIGRAVLRLAQDRGIDVVPCTRNGLPVDGVPTTACDVTSDDALASTLETHKPRIVIHLAGMTSQGDPGELHAVNAIGTQRLASLAARHGAHRIIFASSAAVYGDKGSAPYAESSATPAPSPYGASKLAAENALARATSALGLESVAARIFNVYGPAQPNSLISRILTSSVDSPAVLRGGAVFVRDYVHVDDVAAALLAAAETELPEAFTVINVDTGHPTSNDDLERLFAGREDVHITTGEGPPSYSVADNTKMATLLGIAPRSLAEALSV